MPRAGSEMLIDGLPVRNIVKPIKLVISEEDCRRGDKKSPSGCAAALAAKRVLPEITEARVHIGRIFLKFKNKYWLRGKTPGALRTEIVSFDRGARFEAGEYTIRPLTASELPGGTMGTKGKKKVTAANRKRVHPPGRKIKVLKTIRSNAHSEYGGGLDVRSRKYGGGKK